MHWLVLIAVDERYRDRSLRRGGGLADIAPTILDLLGLPKPAAMTGSSLTVNHQSRAE